MARSDRDHAAQLLQIAERDHRALTHMQDAREFPEEVFGFHAQQAIEKTLKAWIAALGLTYPKTHDLSELLRQLQAAGQDVAPFTDLVDYTVFAVQYRYEAYDESDERLDRTSTIQRSAELLAHVRGLIAADS